MAPFSPAAAPSTSLVAVPQGPSAPDGTQCYVVRDGPREIRITIVPSAPGDPPADAVPTADAPRAAPVRLSIDGEAAARRTDVLINGHRRDLQDCRFAILLRFVVAWLRSPGSWSSRGALGLGRSRNSLTYIREAFTGLVPAGFEVIEGDRRGRFRLNPAIVVGIVAWDVLAEHSSPAVQKVVAEQRRRGVRV